MSKPAATATLVKRAVKAARAAGIDVNCVNILADGTIQVAELDQPMPTMERGADYERFLEEVDG